jgi:hypothetical protein
MVASLKVSQTSPCSLSEATSSRSGNTRMCSQLTRQGRLGATCTIRHGQPRVVPSTGGKRNTQGKGGTQDSRWTQLHRWQFKRTAAHRQQSAAQGMPLTLRRAGSTTAALRDSRDSPRAALARARSDGAPDSRATACAAMRQRDSHPRGYGIAARAAV